MNNIPAYLVIHCSDVSEKTIFDQFKSINAYHKDERAFPVSSLGFYVGYHRLITGGKEYKCKEDWEIGSHCNFHVNDLSMNYQSLGIAIGFDGDIEYPSVVHQKLLKSIVDDLMKKYNIPYERVVFHRDFDDKGKTCPGSLFTRPYLDSIINPVEVKKVENCNDQKLIIETQNKQIWNLQSFIKSLIAVFRK